MSRPGRGLSRKILLRKARLRQLEARTPPSLSLISNVKDLDNHIPLNHHFPFVQANHHNDNDHHYNNDLFNDHHPHLNDFRSSSMEADSISSSHNISSPCFQPDSIRRIPPNPPLPPNPPHPPNPLLAPNTHLPNPPLAPNTHLPNPHLTSNPHLPQNTHIPPNCQGHLHHHHHYNHSCTPNSRNELLAILSELRFMTKKMKVKIFLLPLVIVFLYNRI